MAPDACIPTFWTSASSPTSRPQTRWQRDLHPQNQSSFFGKLPREIRNMIYHELIRSEKYLIQVTQTYDSESRRMKLRATHRPHKQVTIPRPSAPNPPSGLVGVDILGRVSRRSPLGWLLSCQAIHVEAFYLLYFVPAILIPDLCIFNTWWDAVPRHDLNKVHTLHLDWIVPCITAFVPESLRHRMFLDQDRWAGIWKTISGMKGLEKIRVNLRAPRSRTFSEMETTEILEPFSRVKSSQGLSIFVTWHLSKLYMKKRIREDSFRLICAPLARHSLRS